MRKILLLSLVMFLIVGVGGVSISWYSQASATKRSIEDAIATVNKTEKLITYDAIETSGFPRDVIVSIVKPRFNGRIDTLLKNLAPDKPELFAQLPEWAEDVAFDGRVIFAVNAMSDHYIMTISGNSQENVKINGQSYSITHQKVSDITCNLQLARTQGIFNTLWNFHTLTRDGDALLHDFRMIDCATAGNSATDATSRATISSVGPVRLYVTSTPQANMLQMRVYAKITDATVTPEGDAFINTYMQALSPESMPTKWSAYGKQNIELDFTYNGPSEWKKENTNPPLDIALNKFDINNQIYNEHSTLFISNAMKEQVRNARLAFKNEMTFAPQYDTLVQYNVRSGIHAVYNSKNPKFLELQTYLRKYPEEQLYNIIYPVMPNFSALGKTGIALDVGYNGAPDFTAGDVTLNDLELSALPYGIKGKGNAKLAAKQQPQGQAQLACTNCLNMIDDMAAFANRIQKMVSAFDPVKAAGLELPPERVEGIKRFLSAVAAKDPANATTLNFNFASAQTGPTLNGKTPAEIMPLFNEYVAPTLPSRAPVPAPAPVMETKKALKK
jgi:hypothetical protein